MEIYLVTDHQVYDGLDYQWEDTTTIGVVSTVEEAINLLYNYIKKQGLKPEFPLSPSYIKQEEKGETSHEFKIDVWTMGETRPHSFVWGWDIQNALINLGEGKRMNLPDNEELFGRYA